MFSNICCFKKKMIKNVLCNKSKKTLLYVSSMCVQLFTAFEGAVLKLYVRTLVNALKSKIAAISMETKCGGKNYFVFFSIFFHTDHNKCAMK